MASHNSPFSKGLIQGLLVDMVACIKELMLDGKAVKIGDLAIFSIGIKSNGANSAEEAKANLVTGYRFKARATGEMTVAELKSDIQLRELKHYTGGEIGTEEDGEDQNQGGGGHNQNPPAAGNNTPTGGDNNNPPSGGSNEDEVF